ncbi:MAG TPA: MBOAT family protein [Rhodospirillaceae bacterium]|nr:membrane-bound O-acyltransferase family protein [Candidatus Neomarinimicrobiota bacterium]HCX15020.1 MBOAT family protein [Rhodospirillaceae bacterium]
MVFSSLIFIFAFLTCVLAFYFMVGRSWRNATLLIFSIFFYAWGEGAYVAIMIALAPLNWALAMGIDAALTHKRRTQILFLAVILDLGVLLHFKYSNFIVENLNALLSGISGGGFSNEPIHLPLGISFFTFHMLSYIIDVYRGIARPQTSLINFSLYISFFPQLVAGPIIRYHDIATQLTERRMSVEKFASGLERFTFGLGKKMLVANPMGAIADQIFALPSTDISSPAAWLGIVAYSFQIYFDFSAYSDMAIGLARMFGFEFLENFNYPYISRTIQEFWRRWHISLSNWFRDYVYIPLGGNRKGPARTYLNLVIIFLLCGFWHGASWNFLVWGLIHGTFLAAERAIPDKSFAWMPRTLARLLGHTYVLFIVMIAWVFFRADTLPQALEYLAVMFGGLGSDQVRMPLASFLDRQALFLLVVAAVGSTPAFSMLTRDWRKRNNQVRGRTVVAAAESAFILTNFERYMIAARPVVGACVLVLSIAYLAGQTYNPFIYFRF